MKIKTSSLLIAGALLGSAMMPAHANNEAMMDLLKVLRDQGTITAENYELLTNAAKADKEVVEDVVNKVSAAEKKMPKITTKGKIKIESADGNWSFQPIGRIMYDFIDTDEDGSGKADFQGTELRRARLGFQGKVYDWGYKLEADFATAGDSTAGTDSGHSEVSLKDVYVSYGTKIGDMKAGVKLGQSHIPFGFSAKQSSKYMTFMERPLFSDGTSISPDRRSGAVALLADKGYNWLVSAGYTVGQLKEGKTDEDVNGNIFSVRGSFLPWKQDKTHLLQLGAGYMKQSADADSFRHRSRLVSHKDRTRHLDTGTIKDFDGGDAFTADALGIFGSFHVLGEYVSYTADRTTASDIDIDGYSLEASYFLTGESVKWSKGYTSGITPKSKSGAWQVAARFESSEIDGNTAATTDEVDKWTVGVNYYPTQNTRLMLNYDQVTDLTKNGTNVNFEPSALKFRAQAYW
ncbi:MAG: porin [Gammaproteobacteria bacterium]|nr:porin [Gammaproteobacteria bacterium]